MELRICSLYDDDIISVCFFEGCNQYLLCKECLKCHPDNHNSNTKSVNSLMRKDDWILPNEEQRDSLIVQLKSIHHEKECLLSENHKKLRKMIDEIIECLRNRLSRWVKDLASLFDKEAEPDTQETLEKIGDSLSCLLNIDFRKGGIYEQVSKIKQFNEKIMPESAKLCEQSQGIFDGAIRVDHGKLETYKQEVLELIKSSHLKDFFTVSESNFAKQDKDQLLKKSFEETKLNSKEQSEQRIGFNPDYQQKIESITAANKKLQDQILKLKAGLDSLVETKLELQTELQFIKTAHDKFIFNCPKAGLLSEDSQLIQDKDVSTIKHLLPIPANSKKSRGCRFNLLYRGTRDGFTIAAFDSKILNQAPTMTFIKAKGHKRVFGGYTTKSWGQRRDYPYNDDKEAFLFSLKNFEKYPVRDSRRAIHRGLNYIFAFGNGPDIRIVEGCDTEHYCFTDFPSSYECYRVDPHTESARKFLSGTDSFKVEDIEVYEVVLSK